MTRRTAAAPGTTRGRVGRAGCGRLRIECARPHLPQEFAMPPIVSARKRPVNLSLNESLVDEARRYTGNLSETVESLLADFVHAHQKARQARAVLAERAVDTWNAVAESAGSYADAHTTL
ncbi:MAG: hypothetical protein Fur0019_15140 [Tibeticola sp.]